MAGAVDEGAPDILMNAAVAREEVGIRQLLAGGGTLTGQAGTRVRFSETGFGGAKCWPSTGHMKAKLHRTPIVKPQ